MLKRSIVVDKRFIMLMILLALLGITIWADNKRTKAKRFTVCWLERSEGRGEGHCRHNGILTDSGYVFTDTIYSHSLKKYVINKTRVIINEK